MSRYNTQHARTIALVVFVVLFSVPPWCIAQNKNGNELLVDCEAGINFVDGNVKSLDASKLVGAGRCVGFLQGVFAMNYYYEWKGDGLFCFPNSVTYGQYVRIVVKYLRDHPEQLHKDEFLLAATALITAFPCTNKK